MTPKRALLSVSDKTGIVELGKALESVGCEIIATGKTKEVLDRAGIRTVTVESVTGTPEAFGGRMKTLTFPLCSGILFRRNHAEDLQDVKRLRVPQIDCVVVNFYPFESTVEKPGTSEADWIEQIDIGGPTLVRAAAKNSSHVLVLTDPEQYPRVVQELQESRSLSEELLKACSKRAWATVEAYDRAIATIFGESQSIPLRYGENPHQKASLKVSASSPIDWRSASNELSYNNIMDLSAAFQLTRELKQAFPDHESVAIFKHNGPCGVASVQGSGAHAQSAQLQALTNAWAGDPVSAFGGVLGFSSPLEMQTVDRLSDRFIEAVVCPKGGALNELLKKKPKLKWVEAKHFNFEAIKHPAQLSVVGGVLEQTPDEGWVEGDAIRFVTKSKFNEESLSKFGILVCRAIKSNTVCLVRKSEDHRSIGFQLVGAGQGQPNRVEALQLLAIPRAKRVLAEMGLSESEALRECVLISDAFFPFKDSVEIAAQAGIKKVIQPGGSKRDSEVIEACDKLGVAMAFSGVRHFRH